MSAADPSDRPPQKREEGAGAARARPGAVPGGRLTKMAANLSRRREEHQRRSRSYRALYLVAGCTVLMLGLVLTVFPGPAFVVIPIGLAMLALEFAWAESLLSTALERADQAQAKASSAGRGTKVLAALAVLFAIAAAISAALYWDIPLLPF